VIQAHHAGELLRLEARRVHHRDEAVGIRRIAHDQHLHVALGHLVQRLALRREDLAIRLQKILALHAGTARARADEQRHLDILEGNHRIRGGDRAVQQRKRAVLELHHHALQRLLRFVVGNLEQLQNHRLIGAEHFAGGDAEEERIADLACGAGDGDADGRFGHQELRGVVFHFTAAECCAATL
jgi:hypothetical protein